MALQVEGALTEHGMMPKGHRAQTSLYNALTSLQRNFRRDLAQSSTVSGSRILPPLVICLGLAFGACSPRIFEAALLLQDITAGPRPSALKLVTATPKRVQISYRRSDRRHVGDLYGARSGRRRPALVLVPGAAPKGKDDPRLRAFAGSLARIGFVVLVPEIPGLRRLRVQASDARDIADAVAHLVARASAGAGGKVGVVAISYSVGPAVLAALRPGSRDAIAFVLGIGGYYDLTSVVTYITTGHFRERPGTPWRRRRPNRYAKWVFMLSNAHHIGNPYDYALVRNIAQRKWADPRADVAALVARLGPEGRRILALVENRDPDKVAALLRGLPAAARREMQALDLKGRDFSGLGARLILVHGRDDAIIPYTESRRLARAAGTARARLFVAPALFHVDIGALGIEGIAALLGAATSLLEERDRL